MSRMRVSRREFLKAAVAAAAVLAAKQMQRRTQAQSGERIVIIGAGVAGLATAQMLRQAGYRNITVLEGRDRIGGRTWTSHAWSDIPLDMGASWIHGTEGNPIWELAQSAGIATVETDEDDSVTYKANGAELSEAEEEELEETAEWVLEDAEPDDDDDDYSLQDAINEVLDDEDFDAEERKALEFWFGTSIGHEYAAELRELSAKSWDDDEELDGPDVIFPRGYEQIVHLLATGIDDIRLEHAVQEISRDGNGVRIVTTQGEFRADRCVVTVPLGVLKRGTIRFTPPLPADKQRAIDRLGMGLLNKVYLRFPSVFWDRDAGWIDYMSPEKGEWLEWLNLDYYLRVPVLLAFNAGDYGRQIEAMTDTQIVARAMQTLRRIYGQNIPDPTHWQITRWASDPFTYGSYSYLGVGATWRTRDTLAEPVGDVLFFAGEATVWDFPGTVHGAYLSGVRAAEAIIDA